MTDHSTSAGARARVTEVSHMGAPCLGRMPDKNGTLRLRQAFLVSYSWPVVPGRIKRARKPPPGEHTWKLTPDLPVPALCTCFLGRF